MAKFIKYDKNKPMVGLVTPQFAALVLSLYDNAPVPRVYKCKDLAKVLWDVQVSPIHMLEAICTWYESPAHMIEAVAKVLTFGAAKYQPNNWKYCEDPGRYQDALLRHVLAMLKGEECDPESGLHHLDHVLCNIMFLEWFHD